MFGWVAAVGVAVLVVVSYPFYLLYRKKNNRKQSKVEEVESIEEGSAGG